MARAFCAQGRANEEIEAWECACALGADAVADPLHPVVDRDRELAEELADAELTLARNRAGLAAALASRARRANRDGLAAVDDWDGCRSIAALALPVLEARHLSRAVEE